MLDKYILKLNQFRVYKHKHTSKLIVFPYSTVYLSIFVSAIVIILSTIASYQIFKYAIAYS